MLKTSVVKGLKSGLETTWTLGKIIFPVTLIITVLQYTPLLPWLFDRIAPFMSVLGLPGEAAIPLVLGNLLNLYAAIGGILTLELTVKEVFIIAVMLSFCHNLLIETGVALKSGVKLWIVLAVRIGLAIFAAVMINLLWQGGDDIARYGFVNAAGEDPNGISAMFLIGLEKAFFGVLQLAIVVIPLMIGIQILKDLKWLDVFTGWMAPVTRMLGMRENTALVLTAGLIFGLAFGAGVLLQAVKEDGVSQKDATLAFIFLVACHAVVEDTLIFAPLDVPILALFLIRLGAAVLLTLIVGRIWNKIELSAKRKEYYYEAK